MTMLSLTGNTKWYIFCQEGTMDDRTIVRTIADLYRMGCVVEAGGRLVLAEALKSFFHEMKQSEYVVELEFMEGEGGRHLVYITGRGRGIILEMEAALGERIVKLWEDEVAYYVYDLSEKGMLPEGLMGEREEAEAVEETAQKEYPAEYENGKILLRVRRMRAAEGETDNMLDVIHTSIFQWIHVYGQMVEYFHICSREELCSLLIRELKGAEV